MTTKIKVAAISDTHLRHSFLLPKADLLIHAGDATFVGTVPEILKFADWFGGLDYKHKLFIPGNHDLLFEDDPSLAVSLMQERNTKGELHVLINEAVTVGDFTFYGSPATPWFCDWAFNYRHDKIKRVWDMIPEGVDVLVTHGPARGTLDLTKKGEHVGCGFLRDKIKTMDSLLAHIFGHIHESAGIQYDTLDPTNLYSLNASVVDKNYELLNDAITFTLSKDTAGNKKFKLHT